MDTSKHYYAHYPLQYLREQLLKDKRKVTITDLGAGSLVNNNTEKSISAITKASASSIWQCKMMFNLVNHYQPKSILELGSSVGLSTLYLAKANPKASITSIEGDPAIAKVAKENFNYLKAENIDLKVGDFDSVLANQNKASSYDLIFIDGNHTKEATIRYHELLFPLLSEQGIMVYDDIHWSSGMNDAWKEITNQLDNEIVIDLYYFACVFKNPSFVQKQIFRLIPFRYKPYQIGLFGKNQ